MSFRLTARGLTISAILLTVVVVGIGVALAATSTPQFCATCKSHVPYVEEYKKSAHRDVNCEQCHSKPGPFFFLTAKLEALQQPIAQLTGDYEKPILGYVLNQSCRRCHNNDLLFHPVSKNGIRVQHKHLIAAGFLCMRCHSTQAHGDAVPVGSRTYPSMDQCLICHNNQYRAPDGTVATSRCDLCHTKRDYGAMPANHKEPGWSTRHGAVGILSTCSACHVAKDACSKCHSGILMPHPTTWISEHGLTVDKRGDTKVCDQCHDTKDYCKTCHKVPMPHPSDFLATHPATTTRVGSDTCFNCHVVANCQACHDLHAGGDPQAHKLLGGAKYTLPATPAPSSSAIVGGE
ncbi:MAG: NapC/NirT family cytochrome c [Actinobacteria bacterium]|nr:NapC/NirT family cytochrome c [Actinomycetota bacterium]